MQPLKVDKVRAVAMHPTSPYMCMCKDNNKVAMVTISTCEDNHVTKMEEISSVVMPTTSHVTSLRISGDGKTVVVFTRDSNVFILDSADVSNINHTHALQGQLFVDSSHVLSVTTNQIQVFNPKTRATKNRPIAATEFPKHVELLPNGKFLISDGRYLYTDTDGVRSERICAVDFDCLVAPVADVEGSTHIWSCYKRVLQIHDLGSHGNKYTFVDPDTRALRFTALAVHTVSGTVLVGNNTGKFYVLKTNIPEFV